MLKTKSIKILLPILILISCFIGVYSERPNSVFAEEKAAVTVSSNPQEIADGISFIGAYRFVSENNDAKRDTYLGSFSVIWWLPNECFNPVELEYVLLNFPPEALETYTLDKDFCTLCENNSDKVVGYWFSIQSFVSDVVGEASSKMNGGISFGLNTHGFSDGYACSWDSIDEEMSFCIAVRNLATDEVAFTPVVTYSYNSVPTASESYKQAQQSEKTFDFSKFFSENKKKIMIISLTVLGVIIVCYCVDGIAKNRRYKNKK